MRVPSLSAAALFAAFALPAAAHVLEGPTAPKGLTVVVGGEFAMDDEVPSVPGRSMRVRLFTIEPGGVVPVHSHDGRPDIAVVVEGEMTEHRSDEDAPVVLGPGGVSLEPNGLEHWWENRSDAPARIVGYDLYER